MKNVPTKKAFSLVEALKGKKLVVVLVSVGIFVAAVFGVKYGYISEDMINPEAIVEYVSHFLASDTTQAADVVVDQVVDSSAVIVDSLNDLK